MSERAPPVVIQSLTEWLGAAYDAKVVLDAEGTIVFTNPRADALLERRPLVGMIFEGLSADAASLRSYLYAHLGAGWGAPATGGLDVVLETGRGPRLIEVAVSPITLSSGPGLVATLRDVSRERGSVAALAESRARLEALINNAPDVILYCDAAGRVESINRTVAGLPRDAVLGHRWVDLLTEEGRTTALEAIGRALAGDAEAAQVEVAALHPPGTTWLARMSRVVRDGVVSGLVVFARDITAQKREESQLAAAEQLASLGMISAALAHEINNPLAAAMWNVELVLEAIGANEPVPADALEEARASLVALRDVARDLRLFGREERLAVQLVDVNAIVESTLRLARNELRHHARVVVDLQPIPRIRASEARLGQVLLNLLVNAAQAIPQGESEKNQISVRTSLDGPGRVRIDVEDSGVGMTEAVRARLFTPFFTTKPIGIGTGLGLSICQRVVSSLGGEIRVETSPGVGSIFTVSLPAATGEAEQTSSAGTVAAIRRRRVLLIDDDEIVVRALVRALRPHHDVVGVTSAADAIEDVARAQPDVIICDVMMPDTTGAELVERIAARWPSLRERVLFLTGGVFGEGARELEAHEHGRVLHKPIALADLLDAIDRVGPR